VYVNGANKDQDQQNSWYQIDAKFALMYLFFMVRLFRARWCRDMPAELPAALKSGVSRHFNSPGVDHANRL
jgi:hypothetical protein